MLIIYYCYTVNIYFYSIGLLLLYTCIHFGTGFFFAHSVFLTAERPAMKSRNDVMCCVFKYKLTVTFALEAEPHSLFLILGKFEPRCSYIKKRVYAHQELY